MGPNTFVPISWFCKKQSCISNSSTESELISLDAALRVEGIPALSLWELVIDVFHPIAECKVASSRVKPQPALESKHATPNAKSIYQVLEEVDYVPPNLPEPNGRAILVLLEDNDPVIQICIKGRNPTLRHVPRVHRVNIDATYERIREDPGIYMRHWPTKFQMADILTKGSFPKQAWEDLLDLLQLRKRDEKQSAIKSTKQNEVSSDENMYGLVPQEKTSENAKPKRQRNRNSKAKSLGTAAGGFAQ